MKITLNLNELYRLMRKREIGTIRQLSCESGVTEATLYGGIRRKNLSKEAYWKLAVFFGCHIEELQIAVERGGNFMGRYISEAELKARGIDESKCTRVTKKYALADFYDSEDGDLITASDSMNEIRKSAEHHLKDTDGECRLCILRWSDGGEGYIPQEMIF